MKKETESLIVAAKNQSIRTNLVKSKIDRNQEDSFCRLCRNYVGRQMRVWILFLVTAATLHRKSIRRDMTTKGRSLIRS